MTAKSSFAARLSAAASLIAALSLLSACGGSTSSTPVAATAKAAATPGTVSAPRAAVPVSTASPGALNFYSAGGAKVLYITVGPDRLYISDITAGDISSLTYSGGFGGVTGVYGKLPDGSTPQGLTEGIDGNIYFSETGSNLGRYTPQSYGSSGSFSLWNDFLVSTPGGANALTDPDGVLWFLEYGNNSVVRMTTDGSLLTRTQFPNSGSFPKGIAVGADQNSVWVTEVGGNRIAKFNLSGALIAEYSLPSNCGFAPAGIIAGSDGNMYFGEIVQDYPTPTSTQIQGYVGKVTPSGTITCVAAPNYGSIGGPAQGPDGNLWFPMVEAEGITKYTTATSTFGSLISTSGGHPQSAVLGADGQIWFTVYPESGVYSYHP